MLLLKRATFKKLALLPSSGKKWKTYSNIKLTLSTTKLVQ